MHIPGSPQLYEGDALRQLEQAAGWPGMVSAAAMPDLHPGKGGPVGAAFLSLDRLYPALLGNDVGCGMGLWRTTLHPGRIRLERLARRLRALEEPWDGDGEAWLAPYGVERPTFLGALGTIGGGNHFVELQAVTGDGSAIDRDVVHLLVHSGSRGRGEALLRQHVDRHRAQGLEAPCETSPRDLHDSCESAGEVSRRKGGGGGNPDRVSPPLGCGPSPLCDEAREWLLEHDDCVRWARANRALLAARVLHLLDADGECLLDLPHNFVERATVGGVTGWLHRKGATPADRGLAVVPGSRGTLTYLVEPHPLGPWIHSIAHGAGRKWARSECRDRLKGRVGPDDLRRTPLGGLVVCEDRDLLYEEAPQAYRNVDKGVEVMVQGGVATVLATLKPVLTYKVG